MLINVLRIVKLTSFKTWFLTFNHTCITRQVQRVSMNRGNLIYLKKVHERYRDGSHLIDQRIHTYNVNVSYEPSVEVTAKVG